MVLGEALVGGCAFMDNLEEGLRWFDQASADLKTARDCLRDGNYYACLLYTSDAADE